ncbi:hypothetical protein EBH_0030340 [Eimeria brunetti]|uniref:Transmembrane protein n=1 Tax=Eimeria brunetti TaxID=51314 RepID=U6LL92_9EIME|nr:hypothetical protein EBH_0030340 [Eimeria brunetti]
MDPHSHQFPRHDMSSFGTVEEGSVLYSEGKPRLECGDQEACVQQRFKRNPSSVVLLGRVGATFISLAVVYFLLRCFVLIRGGYRVAPLNRSLAVGGSRQCHRDGEDQDDEEDGEDAEGEEFWIGEVEGTPLEGQAAAKGFGHWVQQEGDTRRWPSTPAVASPGDLIQSREAASGREHARDTEEHAIDTAMTENYAKMLEGQWYGDTQVGDTQHLQSREGPEPGPGELKEGDEEGEEMNIRTLLEGETLQMWEGRNLPPYNEVNLVSVFSRMMETASACLSLLTRLTDSERLRLSYAVMGLLALELGAFSLVPEHLECLRSNLGDATLKLGIDALTNSGTQPEVETYRAPLREMIALVLKLKEPRPKTEKNDPARYRKKMVSLLQTATPVVGYCLGVVRGMLQFMDGHSTELPSGVVDQQIDVVKALYDVHSAQVAMDASLRHFIIRCQRRTKVDALFSDRHLQLAAQDLPPLVEMVNSIHEAVRKAGGLVLTPLPSVPTDETPAAISPRTSQHLQTREPLAGTARGTQPHEIFTAGLQLYPRWTGVPAPQNLHAAAESSPPPHPILSQLPLGRPAPHYYPPQPPSPQFPHPGTIPLVSRGHPQNHSFHRASPQVTQRDGSLKESMLEKPALTPERESASGSPQPYWAARRGPTSTSHSHSQQSRSVFVGAAAPVEAPGYPSHGGYGDSDEGAQAPLWPTAGRPTEQPSGAASRWDYGRAPPGASQQHEAEQEEEVGGLLAELLKGGVQHEYVFGRKKLPDQ